MSKVDLTKLDRTELAEKLRELPVADWNAAVIEARMKADLDLIRSLREELAAARDAERDQIVDLIMDPRFDHLLDSRATCEIVAAIRNNEHRSNT